MTGHVLQEDRPFSFGLVVPAKNNVIFAFRDNGILWLTSP